MSYNQEFKKLDHLFEKLKQSGGKKNTVESSDEKNNRHFKLISVEGKEVEEGGRYELKAKTNSGKDQRRGPKEIASKVFTNICAKYNKKDACKFLFKIQETTRDSKHKIYTYEGVKEKLKKPNVVERVSANGKKIKVEFKYHNVLKSLGSELPKNFKGGTVFYS